jgi:hypothetical protein
VANTIHIKINSVRIILLAKDFCHQDTKARR